MKIEFRKVSNIKTPFEIKNDLLFCQGTFKKLSHKVVDINFTLQADITLSCDRCGESYIDQVDEKMHLQVCDGNYDGDDLDIVECYDHYVDFDAIISGEIEAIKSDYHYCKNCKETQGE